MATRQPLKGSTAKTYEIINNFNRGYNTTVTDDLIGDNVFRNIENCLPREEGTLSKRPGLKSIGLYDALQTIIDGKSIALYKDTKGYVNGEATTGTSYVDKVKPLMTYLGHLKGIEKTYSRDDYDIDVKYNIDKLSNFTIIKNDNIIEAGTNLVDIVTNSNNDLYYRSSELDMLFIFNGKYSETSTTANKYKIFFDDNGLTLIRVKFKFHVINELVPYITINYSIDQPSYDADHKRYKLGYKGDDIIDFAIYSNKYYFMNGIDAIVELDMSKDVNNYITEIYKDNEVIYKPTAIEVSNIGFNILASDPLSYITSQGTADAVRGIFFTVEGEPVQKIPFNKEFSIHIMTSGTGSLSKPQYRQDNGIVDTEQNPYKEFPGSYDAENSNVFNCTGVNLDGNYEIKVTKGSAEYINYFTTGSYNGTNLGKVADISNLVLSSKYCKFVNNQLVLYGNHGYMFFSEFDNFKYFPNYFYLYTSETNDEEVVSINYFRQYYAIFTNKRLKRMTGAFGSEDFGLYPLNDFVGCINPHTIKQIQNYLYFMSDNGIYMLKQGYVGEGTENVQQIDLPIYQSYNTDNIQKALNIGNYYLLVNQGDTHEQVLYNFVNDAFYKLKYKSRIDKIEGTDVITYKSIITSPYQNTKLPYTLYYGYMEKTPNESTTKFDLVEQNFQGDQAQELDKSVSFNSTFETPYLSLGYPTNTKKFKQIYLKFYNKYSHYVPLYVTIKVDDKVVLSPNDYVIKYDAETKTYYYTNKNEPNASLNESKVLGTLKLGEDKLGVSTMQILKLRISEKGRSIKIIVSDGLEIGTNADYYQNFNNFALSTIGIVYKLKKVKEG